MPATQNTDPRTTADALPQPEPAPCTGCERLKQINKKIEKAANLSEETRLRVRDLGGIPPNAEFLEWRKEIMARKKAGGPHPDVSDEDSKEMEAIDFRYYKKEMARKARRSKSSPYTLQKLVPCPKFELDSHANLTSTSLSIFRPNTIEYEVPAWVCKIMKESVKLYTNMAGNDFPKDRTDESEVVSPIECQQMAGMVWRTSNPLDLTSPGFWSWGWYERSTVNCILYETKVYAKFGSQQIRVPLGEAEDCSDLERAKRSKRKAEAKDEVGIVYSNQLAASLQALELGMMDSIKNMMMVNISEVFPSTHFDEVAHAWHIQEAIAKGSQKQTGALGEKLLYVVAWYLERRISRRQAQRNQQLHRALEETGSWPPPPKATRRHSELPDRVRMATVGKEPVAQVVAQVNDVHMVSLLDSGSTLTVAGIDVASVLGVTPIPYSYGALTVSGDTLNIIAYADVKVTLGSLTRKARIAFTSNEHLLGDTPYDILIGTDTLERFPRYTMDFERREVSFGDCVLKLTGRKDKLRQPVAVRMAETIEIPANTEEFVRCHVMAITESDSDAFYVEETDRRLLERGLILTPSLVQRTNETYLLVSNFSEEDVRLYSGMRIGTAQNAEVDDDEVWLHEESPQRVSAIRMDDHEEEHDPAYVVDIDSCEITEEQKAIFAEVLEEYDDVFSKHAWDIGCCKVEPAEIRTTTDVPISARPYRIPPKLLPHLKEQIAKMKKHDVLKDSDTVWVSNLVPVRKALGETRLCVDLRKLNAVSVPSRYPIPRVEKLIEKLSDSTYFSTCDMTAGFFQIGLSEETSEKFGIILEDEVFQFTRLPFGHVNSTAIFGRAMAVVFEGLTGILTYVDDILCYTKEPDFEAHLAKLREMFQRLREFDMKLKPQKSRFFQKEVTYLGLTIRKDGYGPAEKNVEAIRNFPVPTDLKKVKRFLGMAGYYRKGVKNFGLIAEPLTRMSRKDVPFVWDDEKQLSFDELKSIISSYPVLGFPDYTQPWSELVQFSCRRRAKTSW
ncbi:Gap-Pol polyprotein-like protein [Aphelenchoides avenae]|nr:Gap-Pol polyprotein-like protein [Aphelenchus avenae]